MLQLELTLCLKSVTGVSAEDKTISSRNDGWFRTCMEHAQPSQGGSKNGSSRRWTRLGLSGSVTLKQRHRGFCYTVDSILLEQQRELMFIPI